MFPKNALSGASLAAVAFLCSLALCARAGERNELAMDLLVEQDYDSNVLALESKPIGSAVTTVRPSIGYENTGTLGWTRLDGWLSSHTYWEETGLNGVDRGISTDVSRTILPLLTLFGNGSYQRVAPRSQISRNSTITFTDSGAGVPGQPVIQPGQIVAGSVPNVDIGQGEFGARYLLSPRSKLSVSGGPYSVDYLSSTFADSEFRDSTGWFGRVALEHSLTALDRLTVSFVDSSTDLANVTTSTAQVPNPSDPANPEVVDINTGKSLSDQQNLSIGWDRTWSEVWTTHFSIGGRRLHSQTLGVTRPITRVTPTLNGGVVAFEDFVPTNFDDTGPGLIGGFSIERALPRGSARFSYQRETINTGSLSSSNVNVDTVELSWVHRLSARATFSALGSYEHYESTNNLTQVGPATYIPGSYNPITGPEFTCSAGGLIVTGSGRNKGGQCSLGSSSSLTSNVVNASARIDWQLRKRLSTFAVLRFEDRVGDVELFGNDYNRFNVGVGFTYAYGLGL